jgi:hypothetical protein
MSLSLWLVPQSEERARLQALIARLSERLGTPPFAAHLTLLSPVDAALPAAQEAAGSLAAGLRAVPLRLSGVSHSEEFFRCVVLEAEPSPALLAARRAAIAALGPGSDGYRPHLSLVYATLNAPQRAALADELRATLPLPLETRATSLELHDTAGPVAAWTLEAAFPLA